MYLIGAAADQFLSKPVFCSIGLLWHAGYEEETAALSVSWCHSQQHKRPEDGKKKHAKM